VVGLAGSAAAAEAEVVVSAGSEAAAAVAEELREVGRLAVRGSRRSAMAIGAEQGQMLYRQRLRPARGAKSPSASAWGWGPTRK